MEELISIIIPVYNVEQYLEKCIDSLISQTYNNIEILLIDDGSTDNSPKICDEYSKKDSRVRVIHKANGGAASARNVGVAESKGSIIAFVDSDDYVDPDTYFKSYALMKETQSDIVIYGRYVEYGNIQIIKADAKQDIIDNKEAIIRLNSDSSFDMAVWDKIYRKEVIENIKFPEGITAEDCFVTCRYLYNAKKIAILPEAKYHYIQRKSSVSKGKRIRYDIIDACYDQKKFIQEVFSDIEYIGNTALVFAYISIYNRVISEKVYIDPVKLKEIKTEPKKYRKDLLKNSYLKKSRKLQALIFSTNLVLYRIFYSMILLKRKKYVKL